MYELGIFFKISVALSNNPFTPSAASGRTCSVPNALSRSLLSMLMDVGIEFQLIFFGGGDESKIDACIPTRPFHQTL